MSISKGSIEKIKNHVLKILDGKICSELNKLFDERQDEIYRSVLESIFSKKYEEDIYNACLDTVLTAFDPANNEVKILEEKLKNTQADGEKKALNKQIAELKKGIYEVYDFTGAPQKVNWETGKWELSNELDLETVSGNKDAKRIILTNEQGATGVD